MQKTNDDIMLYRVAKSYYINNQTQNEIAKREHTSRSQISRMLTKARETGIVDIRIKMPETVDKEEIEEKLREELSLKSVLISPSGASEEDSLSMLQTVAAEYLSASLGSMQRIGVGWGRTIHGTVMKLGLQESHDDLTFFPVSGNSGVDNPYLQADSICARFAEKFQAHSHFTSSLIINRKEHMSDIEMRRLDLIRRYWSSLDAIVLSVGGPVKSGLFFEEFPEDLCNDDTLTESIGDIVCNFVTKDNSMIALPDEYESAIIRPDQIKKTPEVICIACGRSKAQIIRFAAQAGYIKTLITDSDTALAILA